jgi:glutamate racemase
VIPLGLQSAPDMEVPYAIGIFDSGVGGLSVWREIVHQLPQETTVYVADQAHVPYGSRHLTVVQELSEAITRFLLDQGARIIVVACNTASAAALYHLRRTFRRVPFVGMEPALKPAIERTRTGVVGVIATKATFQGELFASLLDRYAADIQVLSQECPGLVEAVEAGELDTPGTEDLLQSCLRPLIEAGADQLVLGCTHYPFLRPAIERIVGTNVTVIDPARAVACQTGRVLQQQGLWANPNTMNHHVFYTSGDVPVFTKTIGRLVPTIEKDVARIEIRAAHWSDGHLKART